MSNLIYIMGKSSAGKDTVYKSLKDKIDTNIYIPYTTRPMREGEKDGVQYFFSDEKGYEQLLKDRKIILRMLI